GGRRLYINSPGYGLPYYARFTSDVENRWIALGGAWEIVEGAMRNDANDRGAKLVMGSPNWEDYIVEADVQLQGEGSVGVLARVNEAEVGENSFKGYFLGVRTVDNSLVLGAFDFAYHEAARVVLPDPVRPLRWYHVKLKVDGCQITAYASAQGMGEVKTAPLNDPDCFRSGAIALRSNGTGGIWRNVRAAPVDSVTADAGAAAQTIPPPAAGALHGAPPLAAARRGGTRSAGDAAPSVPTQTIRSLSYLPPFGPPEASVRGSVTLIRPAVYVQDSTGGVEVQSDNASGLKIGDEVEVTGEIDLDKFSPVIRKARFRLLREATPVSPVVLTANQVAEAQYDSRFVQVEGHLRTMSAGNDGAVTLDLDAGAQSFRAILPPGRSRSLLRRLAQESRLRLRGVSVVDARFNKEADPFVLLVRSAEDVEVMAGPPWWRPSRLILATLAGLILIIFFNYLYLLAKHWRFRAVADERERLANEIHDTLAQCFAGIGFQLQAIRNSVPQGAELLEGQVDLAISMARTSHGEARRSIASLRPKSLGDAGLLMALRECAERMVKNGNVTVEAHGADGGRTVPPHIKDTLYLIGQEAIANSIRHAAPSTIRIRLERMRDSICLSVEDDGKGFIADSHYTGFGIFGMRKRAESISATLTVKSAPGSGALVEVKAPVRPHFLLGIWPRLRLSAIREL
ncbi:MAG TPA: histidine kinase, partial [Blastocatellia bacterium]|nr:histidine kinase [Blastocatellia bacterium]